MLKKLSSTDNKINQKSKILVLGGAGMVGKNLLEFLGENNYENILAPTRQELDLNNQVAVNNFFAQNKPEYVFHLAAIVGGIKSNNEYPADFIYQNTIMHSNVFNASHQNQVKKILFPGSACTYPKLASQPIKEESFLDGKIEITNIAYAAAKINGIIMAQSFTKQYGMNIIIPMPTNSYGIGDNFDPDKSHVIPALMTKLHQAKLSNKNSVTFWGTGSPLREFIYVDDFVAGIMFLMENYNSPELINLGTMGEYSIKDLAIIIAKIVGFKGDINFDITKPDGAPRKCLDNQKILSLGWKPEVTLSQGLELMYQHHFLN